MWTLPNVITLIRICFTPVIALLPFIEGYWPKLIAFIIFLAAALSDVYDGTNGSTPMNGAVAMRPTVMAFGRFILIKIGSRPWPVGSAGVRATHASPVRSREPHP